MKETAEKRDGRQRLANGDVLVGREPRPYERRHLLRAQKLHQAWHRMLVECFPDEAERAQFVRLIRKASMWSGEGYTFDDLCRGKTR